MGPIIDPALRTSSARCPGSRRACGAAWWNGALHILGGFGVRGSVAPDDVGADLWCYENGWRALAPFGPPASRYPALCAGPDALYLFGGCGSDANGLLFFNDLWRYDDAWQSIEPVSDSRPDGRYTAALAAHDNRLVVCGGHAQAPDGSTKTYFDDLWAFDLVARRWWSLEPRGVGPGPRYGFGWVAGEDALHVFGGFDGERDRGDLWTLDLDTATWRLRAAEGPAPRYCPALGLIDGQLVLFGGRSKTDPKRNFSDTWIFDGAWRPVEGSSPGYHAKPGYASGGGGLWLYGGEGSCGHVSDLWYFDGATWHCLEAAGKDDPVFW